MRLSTVADVLVNVTVVDAVHPGWVGVGPYNGTSNGNFVAGAPSATLALVPWYSAGRPVDVYVSASADVVVDVQGYVTSAQAATTASFTPLGAPRRIADSREVSGLHPFGPNETQSLDVRAAAGLPAAATAAFVNLTVANATTGTFVTGWSGNGLRPNVSSVNAGQGDVVANRALVPLDAAGRIALYNLAGRTDLVVDVVGYLSPDAAGSFYTADDYPIRIVDATSTATTVQPTFTGRYGGGDAPPVQDLAPTTAVWLTVVGDQPAGPGFVVARPGGSPPTGTSDVNLVPSRAVANAGPVGVAANDGTVTVAASVSTRLVVDLSGWFRRAATAPSPGLWSGSGPQGEHRWTVPTTLPVWFAGGVFQGDDYGASAYAVSPGGSLQSSSTQSLNGKQTLGPWDEFFIFSLPAPVRAVAGEEEVQYPQLFVLDRAGSLMYYGANDDGEATAPPGDPVRDFVHIPLPGTVTAVFANYGIGYAVLADGSVWSWGRDDTAELGRAATATPWTPAPVSFGGAAPTSIAGDYQLSFALDTAGRTTWWGAALATDGSAAPSTQVTPTPDASACPVGKALHDDIDGVWELCADGSVVQLSDAGRHVDRVLPISRVTAIGAGEGEGSGIRALLSDGRVADVTASAARYEAGFVGVTAIAGSRAAQLTLVGS